MRFRFGIRSLLLFTFAIATFLVANSYVRGLRRESWRDLAEPNFKNSLKLDRLVLLEFSEISPRVRWDPNNDFEDSPECWKYLNWNDIHAYQVGVGLYDADKKWLLDWLDHNIADRDVFTAVVVYDPLKDELLEIPNRAPNSLMQSIREWKNAR